MNFVAGYDIPKYCPPENCKRYGKPTMKMKVLYIIFGN
jgi:hypothetical protein